MPVSALPSPPRCTCFPAALGLLGGEWPLVANPKQPLTLDSLRIRGGREGRAWGQGREGSGQRVGVWRARAGETEATRVGREGSELEGRACRAETTWEAEAREKGWVLEGGGGKALI